MERREWLVAALGSALIPPFPATAATGAAADPAAAVSLPAPASRVRPSDPAWPSASAWAALSNRVHGRLQRLESPFATDADGHLVDPAASRAVEAQIGNPFFLGDDPALTQTSGWFDAWRSQPSAWVVAAESAQDVAAAIDFARVHRLRLVVKGGGHSYQGGSQSADSLLVWTRRMNAVQLHDAFVPKGGTGPGQPSVTLGAGAMWSDAYDAVTTKGGRYVQGGGCTTVGVAGLVMGGGFGNFSKRFGLAAAGLLEAEVVTADGRVRVANAYSEPELFWAIKGGGGGSFGVVTRLTLRTRPLPDTFGAVSGYLQADSDVAYRLLVARVVAFYGEALFNPHWGEQITLAGEKGLRLSLVFQDLTREQAEAVWKPFTAWVDSQHGLQWKKPLQLLAIPARHFWDAEYFREHAPGFMASDERPGAPTHHAVWSGDRDEAGWFVHGYRSTWLPASALETGRQGALVDALLAAKDQWDVSLHFNKGLAGAPAEELAAAHETAVHPHAISAFALAICAGGSGPAYAGQPGPKVDVDRARRHAATIDRAMTALRVIAPDAGSYVNESDWFEKDWQMAFWGSTNYSRLIAIKHRYDPDGLFFVRHGVGSEAWSDDGFTRQRV